METLVNIFLLTLLVIIAIAIILKKDLLSVVMLAGIYGLVSASFFVTVDAVDVAFTEASVGAGISTLLMLVAITMTGHKEHRVRHKPLLSFLLVMVVGGLLIYGTFDMPPFGVEQAPVHVQVAPRYINDSFQEVGVPNIVTSVLASYRGFDTFGEVVVIFTAGIGVLALLAVSRQSNVAKKENADDGIEDQQIILRVSSKVLIPFILLFGLYVQFHGDFGPGGGFQAGVIFAAGIILYAMTFGMKSAKRLFNQTAVRLCAALGVLIYGSVGIVSLLNGGHFLDYSVIASDPVAGQHLGILLIELGVGVTVASVIILIFFNFSLRKEYIDDQQDNEKSRESESSC